MTQFLFKNDQGRRKKRIRRELPKRSIHAASDKGFPAEKGPNPKKTKLHEIIERKASDSIVASRSLLHRSRAK